MGNEKAEELIRKYLEGTATPEEEALLESWYIEMAQQQPDMPGISDYSKLGEELLASLRSEQREIPLSLPPAPKSTIKLWPRIAAAAAAVIFLVIGGVLFFRKEPAPAIVQGPTLEHDIQPAGVRATLTLLDGKTISVDSGNGGTVATQGNTVISTNNGQLSYHSTTSPQQAGYNTLTTAPGEHYSLVLPDGTKAWLNAASSITYPVVFNSGTRTVKVTGEVYLEVVHNVKQPFQTAVRDELIDDIGTQFNINAYTDEPFLRTTLLEGSIKVTKGSTAAILKPGQQAASRSGDSAFQIKSVDADAAIAWKNGYFYFDRADIQTVMRELARWYGIQVVYKGPLPKKVFKGKVYRNINASEALQILSYFGAHFEIERKTITVTF